ncbi:importin subunit alpha [Gregarina niphandrodes]|uniref:Importin subunit alpha n=1 Tax=Gregarina niphandrodes TaxID=110365 RepID=A0A023B4J7_GRENI|nr:importin subunit alpha [Gregarina niphandrodes]EZG56786.1 importin subunit alpha [Gregarina niphandrodes]|eukprot:XP_011131152.1 importin subunit alpha [Gregarina niphandrodes]
MEPPPSGDPRQHPLPAPPPPSKADDAMPELVELLGNFDWAVDTVEKCARLINSESASSQDKLRAVQDLKQLLCTSRDHVFPIAQDVIDSGALVGLTKFVSSENPVDELRLPAAFCLTNIAAGSDEQTAAVVCAGAVPAMLQLLSVGHEGLVRQAIFCLANIAGSKPEYRVMLADEPSYFRALRYAILASHDSRIEELAGWNLRNIVVLGGVPFEKCLPALNIFIEKLRYSVPARRTCVRLMMNGSATLASIHHNTANWFRYGPLEQDGVSGLLGPVTNRSVLRFSAEAFSHISRLPQGQDYLIKKELVLLSIHYLAKFSPNPSVRNYALECLVNLANHPACMVSSWNGGGEIRFIEYAPYGLGEMLADPISYSPHQRALAARVLWRLAEGLNESQVMALVNSTVITRTAMLATKRNLVHGALSFVAAEQNEPEDLDLDLEAVDLATNGSATQSVLEIALKIYQEYEHPEELALREKCARIVLAVLGKVSYNTLLQFIDQKFVSLVVQLAEFAFAVDRYSKYKSFTDLNTEEHPGNENAPAEAANNTGMSAEAEVETATVGTAGSSVPAFRFGNIHNALLVGEPTPMLPQVFLLLEKLFAIGEDLRVKGKGLENAVTSILTLTDNIAALNDVLVKTSGLRKANELKRFIN